MHFTISLLIATFFYYNAFAITLETSSAVIIDNQILLLTCTTPDFADNIIFKQNTLNRLVCFANSASCVNDATYSGHRSGSTKTVLTLKVLETRDTGEWECTYGTSVSNSVNLTTGEPETSATGICDDRICIAVKASVQTVVNGGLLVFIILKRLYIYARCIKFKKHFEKFSMDILFLVLAGAVHFVVSVIIDILILAIYVGSCEEEDLPIGLGFLFVIVTCLATITLEFLVSRFCLGDNFFHGKVEEEVNVSVKIKSTYAFSCPPRTYPTDEIEWFFTNKSGKKTVLLKNGLISKQYEKRFKVDSCNENYTLSGLEKTDEGVYTCIASTAVLWNKEFNLTVEDTGISNASSRVNRKVSPKEREQPDGQEHHTRPEERTTISEANARHIATTALASVPSGRELPLPPCKLPPIGDQTENSLEKKEKRKKKKKVEEDSYDV